jgi:hypothetical protein
MHWVKAMEFEYAELALRIRSGRCEISVDANCGFTPVGYLVNHGCFVIFSLSPKEGFSHPSQIPRVNLGQIWGKGVLLNHFQTQASRWGFLIQILATRNLN